MLTALEIQNIALICIVLFLCEVRNYLRKHADIEICTVCYYQLKRQCFLAH